MGEKNYNITTWRIFFCENPTPHKIYVAELHDQKQVEVFYSYLEKMDDLYIRAFARSDIYDKEHGHSEDNPHWHDIGVSSQEAKNMLKKFNVPIHYLSERELQMHPKDIIINDRMWGLPSSPR